MILVLLTEAALFVLVVAAVLAERPGALGATGAVLVVALAAIRFVAPLRAALGAAFARHRAARGRRARPGPPLPAGREPVLDLRRDPGPALRDHRARAQLPDRYGGRPEPGGRRLRRAWRLHGGPAHGERGMAVLARGPGRAAGGRRGGRRALRPNSQDPRTLSRPGHHRLRVHLQHPDEQLRVHRRAPGDQEYPDAAPGRLCFH